MINNYGVKMKKAQKEGEVRSFELKDEERLKRIRGGFGAR